MQPSNILDTTINAANSWMKNAKQLQVKSTKHSKTGEAIRLVWNQTKTEFYDRKKTWRVLAWLMFGHPSENSLPGFPFFSQRELAPSWVESWRSHLSTTHLSLANSRLLLWTPVCWLFTIQNHIIIHVAHVSCWLCKVWNWFHSCYWKSFRQIYMIQIELYKKIHMEIPEKKPLKFPLKFPNPYPVRGKRRAGKSPLWFCWFGRCWENHRTIAGGIFISHGNDDTRGCF